MDEDLQELLVSERELREEWTVGHAQGIHPGPFTEQQARQWIADDRRRDEKRQLASRGRQRLLRRYVTEWEQVAE
jgi:hypothetical protein